MTVPHLMNCPHTDSGWCTECVAELGNENWRQRETLEKTRGALAEIHTSADMTLRLARKKAGRVYLETKPRGDV